MNQDKLTAPRPRVSARQLEAFRAVMLSGSTRGAAELLCVTQPVVSKLLAQLEGKIGFALFDRRGNAIAPNDKAKLLLGEAQGVFEGIERFDRFAAKLRDDDLGRLTILASPTLASGVIPFVIRSNPVPTVNVEISIATRLIGEMPADLLADSRSIGLSIWRSDAPGLECTVLASRVVMLLVHPDNPIAARHRPNLSDLRSEDLIVYRESLPIGRKLREALNRLAPGWPVKFSVDSSEVAYALVQNNLGVALVDAFSKDHLRLRGLKLVEVDIDVCTELCLLRSSFHKPSVHSLWFEDAVRNWLRSA